MRELETNLAAADLQIEVLVRELVEVARQRDRLQRQLEREADDQAKRSAIIESIPHGGLKVLFRLANDTAEVERMLREVEPQWLSEFAVDLLTQEGETGAVEVLRKWLGGNEMTARNIVGIILHAIVAVGIWALWIGE